jgi:ADP-ribose pyrophosphatase YjhB (NUDIX family)
MDEGTPNAVSVAIVRGGSVLLIRRARQPHAGSWTLPGGRIDAGERPETAARREIGEELGLTLGALVPVTEMAAAAGWRLAVFAAAFPGGGIVVSEEVGAWRWVEPGGLSGLATTPGLRGVLESAVRAAARVGQS